MSTPDRCRYCNDKATKRCSSCKEVYYCCKEHQKLDWPDHRIICRGSLHCRPIMKEHACCGGQHIQHGEVEVHGIKPDPSAHKSASVPTQEDLISAILARAHLKERDGPYAGKVESFVDVRLCFNLVVETDKPPYQKIPGMMNLFCYPDTKLIRCTASNICKSCKSPLDTRLDDLDLDDDGRYPISKKEFKKCALRDNNIKMESGIVYKAPDGKQYFSLKDLIDVILKDEEVKRRDKSNFWFGGIDVHNILFEGLKFKGGVYIPHWGS